MVPCFKAAIALSLRRLSRLILVVTISCFIGLTTSECIFNHCCHSPLPASLAALPRRGSSSTDYTRSVHWLNEKVVILREPSVKLISCSLPSLVCASSPP